MSGSQETRVANFASLLRRVGRNLTKIPEQVARVSLILLFLKKGLFQQSNLLTRNLLIAVKLQDVNSTCQVGTVNCQSVLTSCDFTRK